MKRSICFVICALLCFSLFGCGDKTSKSKKDDSIYCLNEQRTKIKQKNYKLKSDSTEEQIAEFINQLDKHTLIKPVSIERYSLNGKRLELYFNQDYIKLNKSDEVLQRAAVVQTLLQVENVEFVSFYVAGEPLRDSKGNAIGLMNSESFLENPGSNLYTYQTTPLKLYFPDITDTMLVLDERASVRYNANTSIEKLIVEKLMSGPKVGNAKVVIPSTVKLLGVSVKEGVCYVNFSSSFLTDISNQKPEITIYSIVNSIIANGSVLKVQILIEGASNAKFMDSIDLSQQLEWNPNLLEEMIAP